MGLFTLLRTRNVVNAIRRKVLLPSITRSQSGYVLLLPEIGEDDAKLNPFMKEDGLPEFSNVTVDNCLKRIGGQSNNVEATVKQVEEYLGKISGAGEKPSLTEFFKNVFDPIEKADAELVASWGLAKTLFHSSKAMFYTKNFISLHQRARNATLAKYQSLPIYKTVRELKTRYDGSNELTAEQKRMLDFFSLEGKLIGHELVKEEDQKNLEYINYKLSNETIIYNSKIMVSNEKFSHAFTEYSSVQSFPTALLQAIAVDKKNPLNGPWKMTLKSNVVNGFMEHCPDRLQRWNIWQAKVRRATRAVVTELDNSGHIEWIRDHRKKISQLLGYTNYVHMRQDRLMLTGIEQPQDVIKDLLTYAKPSQKRELEELTDFAVHNGFSSMQLEEYDVPYWRRKYKIAVCKYDEPLIQEYFPFDKVLKGLFSLTENLFGIKIEERNDRNVSRWHEFVKYYDVFDTKKSPLQCGSSNPIAGLFLDAFALNDDNNNRYDEPNGWAVPIRENCDRLDSKPLVSLIYNFSAPLYGKPYILTLKEVHVLFNKFGNALQKLLCEVNYRDLSGHMNIEYVSDRICSSAFSNLLYRTDVLKLISEHVTTKEPLPDEHIQAIQAQRVTLAGYNMCHELFKSAFDLELYSTEQFWLDILRKLYSKYILHPLNKIDSRPCSMDEIITGNWSGNYFSLIWAELVAADISNAFDEASKVANGNESLTNVGQRFRNTFLASGSNADSLELFRNFRGRDPALEALIAHMQLKQMKS